MKILIFGPPGSGKSTQADLIARELGIPHIATGELLHYLSEEDNPQGREIKKVMESGELVDDRLVLKIVEKQLEGKQYLNGFVIDGTPRSRWQAENINFQFDRVFYLKVSEKENMNRLLKRGRKDTDSSDVIKERFRVYAEKTAPMIDYYRSLGILEEVDGQRPVEIIFADILARLKKAGLVA